MDFVDWLLRQGRMVEDDGTRSKGALRPYGRRRRFRVDTTDKSSQIKGETIKPAKGEVMEGGRRRRERSSSSSSSSSRALHLHVMWFRCGKINHTTPYYPLLLPTPTPPYSSIYQASLVRM